MPRHTTVVIAITSVMTIDGFVVEGEVFAHDFNSQLSFYDRTFELTADPAADLIEKFRIEFNNVVACCGGKCCEIVVLVILLIHGSLLVFLFSGVFHR